MSFRLIDALNACNSRLASIGLFARSTRPSTRPGTVVILTLTLAASGRAVASLTVGESEDADTRVLDRWAVTRWTSWLYLEMVLRPSRPPALCRLL